MAEGDEYLDYRDETLERTAKPWSASLGVFLETKWRVLNSPYGQQFEAITFTKTPGRQSGKSSSATKNVPMNTTGTLWLCGDSKDVLGHLQREFSQVAFYFLEHDGSITGRVTDRRRYCRERGGMEIPCKLTFSGKQKHIQKLRRFFDAHQFSCIERFH